MHADMHVFTLTRVGVGALRHMDTFLVNLIKYKATNTLATSHTELDAGTRVGMKTSEWTGSTTNLVYLARYFTIPLCIRRVVHICKNT